MTHSLFRVSSAQGRAFLAVCALFVAHRLTLALTIGLAPEEAYYWTWSQNLDLSYFDHPPLVAYTIRALTEIFGQSVFTIHLSALLWSTLTFMALALFTERISGSKAAAYASVVWLATPLTQLGGFVITPDAPLIALLALTFVTFHDIALASRQGSSPPRPWALVGFLLGLATLAKYTALIGVLGIALYMTLDSQGRRHWRGLGPYVAALIYTATISPLLLWNARHAWASFAFQSSHRVGQFEGFDFSGVLSFLGTQSALVGPGVLLFVLIWIFTRIPTSLDNTSESPSPDLTYRTLALYWGLPLALLCLGLSGFYWVKMNWAAPLYALALPAFGAWLQRSLSERRRFGLNRVSALVAIVSTGLVGVVCAIGLWTPLRADLAPLNTTVGWRELAQRVGDARERMRRKDYNPLIIGWDYKVASELSYHLRDNLDSGETVLCGETLDGEGLQFALWSGNLERLRGRDAILVYDTRAITRPPFLRPYFYSFDNIDTLTARWSEDSVTTFLITYAFDFRPYGRRWGPDGR